MLKRRASRIALTGFLLTVSVSGLTACRTSPSVAAYVGDEQVTVSELQAAVDDRTADEQVAAFAANGEAEFTRRVLSQLVQEQVHSAAAERYGVAVSDADVRTRIDQLIGDEDPDTVYGQLAQQGIGRADVFETVRQQLQRREIALSEGEVEAPSEEELRARYEESREGLAEVRYGYVNVPDQAAADTLRGELQADPSRYAAAAAQYAGEFTLPELRQQPLSEVPPPVAEQITGAQPNTAVTLTVPDVPGVIVAFVAETVYPPFEEVRPQLEQEFTQTADEAGAALVDEVRQDLDVVVNPRYGVLQDTGELVPGGGGVVQLLEESGNGGADGGSQGE